jgi:hypothetical protein
MNTDSFNITHADYLGGYRLRLRFDDGFENVVDFGPFLQTSQHPDIRAFLDISKFRQFGLDSGNLLWGDFELCFPVADLRANRLLPFSAAASAA